MDAQNLILLLNKQEEFKERFRIIEILLFPCYLDGKKNTFCHFIENTESSFWKEIKIKGVKIDFEGEISEEKIVLLLASKINSLLKGTLSFAYYFQYFRDNYSPQVFIKEMRKIEARVTEDVQLFNLAPKEEAPFLEKNGIVIAFPFQR